MLKLKFFLCVFILLIVNTLLIAQVKVGNNPTSLNANSVFEMESTNKGLLMPRVALTSTTVPNPLSVHVEGMNVYNTATISDVTPGNYYNNGTKWIKVADEANVNHYNSIEATGDITTSSSTDIVISGMTLSPQTGIYLVLFNGQYNSIAGQTTTTFNTATGVTDLESIYNELISIPVTSTTHAAIFGNNEVLVAGVYSVGGAVNVQGNLTLDGGGDPNALFIIRAIGSAINTDIGATIILTNGATANNVFWVAGGAIGLGVSTTMKGTLLAHPGAVSAANGCTLQGRMFSSAGTITLDNGTASLPSPSTSTHVNLRSLLNFVIFSGGGALSNTGTSTVTGDLATDAGAITGFGPPSILNGNIYPPGASSASSINKVIASFSIYKNEILLANSTRTSSSNNAQISLQSITTIAAGDEINIRWKVDVGPLTLGNRILTLVNIK